MTCFIGLNDINNEGIYQCVDCSDVDYGPIWQHLQPNTVDGNCVVLITRNSKWLDTPCDSTQSFQQHPFICFIYM